MINEEKGEFGFDRLSELVKEYRVDRFVVGLPENMNNTSGPRVEASQAYGKRPEELFNLPVEYQMSVWRPLPQSECWLNKRISAEISEKVIDKLLPKLILQNYLDRKILEKEEIRWHTIMITTTTMTNANWLHW